MICERTIHEINTYDICQHYCQLSKMESFVILEGRMCNVLYQKSILN